MSIYDVSDADLRRGDIGLAILCHMDFATRPQRWWMGYGPMTTGGVTYQGTGDVIQISSAALSYGMSAGMLRFTIQAASPEMVARCDNQEAEVNGRRCQLLYQLFVNDDVNGQARGRLLGGPISVFVGRMRDMKSISSHDQRSIELEAYGRMSGQSKPPFGRWTDADQRARHPGDIGFSLLPSLRDKAVTWIA